MDQDKREIVIPSQFLGEIKNKKAGKGTFVENGKIYAEIIGVLNSNSNYINVIPLKGRYDPAEKDFVIGIVSEAMASSWLNTCNRNFRMFRWQ